MDDWRPRAEGLPRWLPTRLTWRGRALQKWVSFVEDFFPNEEHEHSTFNAVLYVGVAVLTAAYTLVNVLAPLIVRDCDTAPDPLNSTWDNPLYPGNPCYYAQRAELLGLSLWQADKGQRMMMSLLCGALLGYERRAPDRPAGIKLMCLVSLGSCCFTISSMFCFESSPSSFDTARVSAAVVSGVGFLGSAMIWKGVAAGDDGGGGGESSHQVHGLTTAASVWVAASVGIASGGYLYFAALFTTLTVVILLRFGPRSPERGNDDSHHVKRNAPAALDKQRDGGFGGGGGGGEGARRRGVDGRSGEEANGRGGGALSDEDAGKEADATTSAPRESAAAAQRLSGYGSTGLETLGRDGRHHPQSVGDVEDSLASWVEEKEGEKRENVDDEAAAALVEIAASAEGRPAETAATAPSASELSAIEAVVAEGEAEDEDGGGDGAAGDRARRRRDLAFALDSLRRRRSLIF